jgi:flagellar motor protein MotB
MADKNSQPIIIKKKKGHGHGAHGGAWKVAYADFVTAMMAFFMVMWLLGSDEETKASVANYFNNPTSALRMDMSSKEVVPLGDQTGAGASVLKGAEGEVPEELVKQPSRPLLEGNTAAEDPADVAMRIASSGDKFQVEVMKFSVAEKDIFKAGSSEEFVTDADKILQRIGKLTKNQKFGRIHIRGSVGEDTGNYEFQVSRAVAVARYLVEKKFLEEDRITTSVVKKRKNDDRTPADSGPRVEFSISVKEKSD